MHFFNHFDPGQLVKLGRAFKFLFVLLKKCPSCSILFPFRQNEFLRSFALYKLTIYMYMGSVSTTAYVLLGIQLMADSIQNCHFFKKSVWVYKENFCFGYLTTKFNKWKYKTVQKAFGLRAWSLGALLLFFNTMVCGVKKTLATSLALKTPALPFLRKRML